MYCNLCRYTTAARDRLDARPTESTSVSVSEAVEVEAAGAGAGASARAPTTAASPSGSELETEMMWIQPHGGAGEQRVFVGGGGRGGGLPELPDVPGSIDDLPGLEFDARRAADQNV